MKEDIYSEIKENDSVYRIGVFSKMNQVTIKTLRHYDEIGLLKPAFVEQATGYRYYTTNQLPILHRILALRDMGFSLEEIKQVLNGVPEHSLLVQRKTELMKQIAEATMKLAQVESYLNGNTEVTAAPVIIKELPEVIVASMRSKIPNYDALFSLVPPMGQEMERLGCVCAVPEYCFNIYHDGEYKEEDIDIEVCEAVTEMKQDSDMIHFKVVPKVEMAACILHKGPYSDLGNSYRTILQWVSDNHYEIIDFARESYIDGIWNKDSSKDWLTEIQMPVRPLQKEW